MIKNKFSLNLVLLSFSVSTYGLDTLGSKDLIDMNPLKTEERLSIDALTKESDKIEQIDYLTYIFPIDRPSLIELKKFKSFKHNIDMIQPIFIIGSDKYSKQWLKQKEQELIKIKAIGIILECQTLEKYEEIASLTKLEILPLKGDFLNTNFGLFAYPAIIIKGKIYQ